MTTNFPQQHRCVYLASSLTTKRTSSSVPVTKATLFSCKPDKNVITNYSFLLEVKLFFMLFMFKFKSCNQNVAINLKKICNGSLIAHTGGLGCESEMPVGGKAPCSIL